MYTEELELVSKSAKKKVAMLGERKGKYLLSSFLGGMYICFGTILAYTLGGMFNAAGSPYSKIAIGLSFGIALCLIAFAGADLFTSNTLVMAVGTFEKKTSWRDYFSILICSWGINLISSVIIAFLIYKGGVISESTAAYIIHIAETKISLSIPQLLIRGTFCNVLVCLGIWCTYKLKNETAKLLMILWCVFAFMIAGFEHSIANMGLLTMALLVQDGSGAITIGGAIYNVIFVSIGNIIGGSLILGFSYSYMSKKKK